MPAPDELTLVRNDAYLRVIEGYDLCPFARSCRTTGQLLRRVVRGPDLATALLNQLLELQVSRDGDFEVALLIAPDYLDGARPWEALIQQLNAQVQALLAAQGAIPACYCVAFHPQMAYHTETPLQLVGLLRHSPNPTLQLVRREVLDRVRGYHGEHRFLDPQDWATPAQALAAAEALVGRPPLSDRIAAANYATWQRAAGQLERELEAVSALGDAELAGDLDDQRR
jgi:hypothetical protein